MMRMAGRGADGLAKPIEISDKGSLLVSDKQEIVIAASRNITAGGIINYYVDNVPESFIISGFTTNKSSGLKISVNNYVAGRGEANNYYDVDYTGDVFFSVVHKRKTNRVRVLLQNTSDSDINIESLSLVSVVYAPSILNHITDLKHSDLFNYNAEGDTISTKLSRNKFNLSGLRDITFYLEHNLYVPLSINVYDTLSKETMLTLDWDGEQFTGDYSTLNIPSSSNNGDDTVARYPIHIAKDIFKYPITELEVRVRPKEVQPKKQTDSGKDYYVNLHIQGVTQ